MPTVGGLCPWKAAIGLRRLRSQPTCSDRRPPDRDSWPVRSTGDGDDDGVHNERSMGVRYGPGGGGPDGDGPNSTG